MICSHCNNEAVPGFDLCDDCMQEEVRLNNLNYIKHHREPKDEPAPRGDKRKTARCLGCNNRYTMEILTRYNGVLYCNTCLDTERRKPT